MKSQNKEVSKEWNPSDLKPKQDKPKETLEEISKRYQDMLAAMPKKEASAETQGDKVKTRVWVRDDD